jgi:hypothetical protein
MSDAWHIAMLVEGTGTLEHRSVSPFGALWTTGLDDLAELDGSCWSEAGHGECDAISLYAFRWDVTVPDQQAFEALMREAAGRIDDWIARRL